LKTERPKENKIMNFNLKNVYENGQKGPNWNEKKDKGPNCYLKLSYGTKSVILPIFFLTNYRFFFFYRTENISFF